MLSITNNRDLNRSENFAYDSLNRIAFAWSTGALWGERFEIDPWANLNKIRECQSGDPCYGKPQGENLNQMADGNNRFIGMRYDAAGNLLNDGSGARTYNAENQLLTAAGVTYAYDGDGKRVKKSTGKLYWTGVGSDPLAESALDGTLSAEYVYFNGKRIARFDRPSGVIHYYFSDHLGSASVVTNADATSIQDESDYYPFGGERAIVTGDPNAYKFTGKERDSETNLDNFGARYYGSSLGRFMTPDWSGTVVPVPYALFTDPQTLNLYGYVRNNPLSHADTDGHCCDGEELTYLKEEVKGVYESTVGAAAQLSRQLVTGEAGENMITTGSLLINNPSAVGDALSEGASQFNQLNQAAASGDGRAMGNLVGMVATVFAGAAEAPEGATAASGEASTAGSGKGLTTPNQFFSGKTAPEANQALESKLGPAKSSRPGADTHYNPTTKRSYNVHTDPAHGEPHVDIRTRGNVPDRKIPLKEEPK